MPHVPLLGEQAITDDRFGDVRTRSSRAVVLVVFLAVHAGSPQPRQRIAGLLWPESTHAQALTNLRRELHHLRQVLGAGPGDRPPVQPGGGPRLRQHHPPDAPRPARAEEHGPPMTTGRPPSRACSPPRRWRRSTAAWCYSGAASATSAPEAFAFPLPAFQRRRSGGRALRTLRERRGSYVRCAPDSSDAPGGTT